MALTRRYTSLVGIIYFIFGLLAFAASGLDVAIHQAWVFDVNWVSNVMDIVLGLLALFAFQSGAFTSRLYCQVFGVIFLVLGILGFLTQPLGGVLPLGGPHVPSHLVTAAIGLFLGFAPATRVAAAKKK